MNSGSDAIKNNCIPYAVKGKDLLHSNTFQGGQTWATTTPLKSSPSLMSDGVPFSVVVITQSVYHVMDGHAGDVLIITSVKREVSMEAGGEVMEAGGMGR